MISNYSTSLPLDRLKQEIAAFERWQAEESSHLLDLAERGVRHESKQCCTQGRRKYFRETCAFQACRRAADRRSPTKEYALHCEKV
jgi:hypothetical protein